MNGTKKLSILPLIICFSGFLMVGCVSRPDAGEADLSGGATHLQAVNATIAHAVAETGEPEGEETIYPIDLRSALRLGDASSYAVAISSKRIEQAKARRQVADMLLFPDVRFDLSYYRQDGLLQGSGGGSVDVTRSGSQVGFGTGAIGAGLPGFPGLGLNVDLADVIYTPLAARQSEKAVQFAGVTDQHQNLLSIALAYFELQQSEVRLEIATETLTHFKELAEWTERFAQVGEGSRSEAERGKVNHLLIESAWHEAQALHEANSVRLAELLRLPASTRFVPKSDERVAMHMVALDTSMDELVRMAQDHRPELDQGLALVNQARIQSRQARMDPLIPSIAAGASTGEFAGDRGSSVGGFEGRTEFGGAVYWELPGLGMGYLARNKASKVALEEHQLILQQLRDRIDSEVRQSVIMARAHQQQFELSTKAVESAWSAFRLNREKIHENQGPPQDLLQSIRSLSEARYGYIDALSAYNKTQFRLYTAIGQPDSL